MDVHLVDKRLAWIEAACERLRRLAVPDRIRSADRPTTASAEAAACHRHRGLQSVAR